MVERFVSVNITLATQVAGTASFYEMFLTDEDSVVPVDRRILETTQTSKADDIPASTRAIGFADAFFSQSRVADKLYIGRWVKTASSPYYVTGATSSLTLTDWNVISDGTFSVTDGTNTDDITGVDLTSATSVADIATLLTAELAALGAPTVTDLDSATFEFDNFGRLRLVHTLVTGASGATLTIVSEGTGTDLTGASYMDIASGATISGLDAEEPTAAVTAIRAVNGGDNWYKMAIREESTAQQLALASQFESLDKQLVLVTSVAADKDPASTTDVPYQLAALNYRNTSIIYTEHTTTSTGGWVDAYTDGVALPATEGSVLWNMQALSGALSSGKDSFGTAIELTTTETSALEAKECNWLATAKGFTFLTPGHVASGDQINIILGKHWLEDAIQTDIFNYNLVNPYPAFDDVTLAAYEGIVERRLNEALSRNFIVNTADRPITITFPEADDFTAAERASGTMELTNVFTAYINAGVERVVLTGTFRI